PGTIIKKVHKTHLELKDQPDEPYGLLVWSTGITMRPLVANFDVSKDRTRRIVTDAHLRVFGKDGNVIPNVCVMLHCGSGGGAITFVLDVYVLLEYAVGDCATVKDNDLPPTDLEIHAAPFTVVWTAQVASQKGIYLAKELNKSNSGSNTSFTYNHLGTAADDIRDWLRGFVYWILTAPHMHPAAWHTSARDAVRSNQPDPGGVVLLVFRC
ncbi:MAG: hypothetical protein BJ554DRAFT_7207, partial [Olpidium bornovanus]